MACDADTKDTPSVKKKKKKTVTIEQVTQRYYSNGFYGCCTAAMATKHVRYPIHFAEILLMLILVLKYCKRKILLVSLHCLLRLKHGKHTTSVEMEFIQFFSPNI
jgi:hypothetical protein